jgi:hypothetical protein
MSDDSQLQSAFAASRPMETALNDALNSTLAEKSRQISVTAGSIDPNVRGAFVRWLVLEAIPSRKLPITRVELRGAVIDTELDLAGTKLDLLLRFVDCHFKDSISLDGARIVGFDLFGGSATAIAADGLIATGSIRLCGAREFGSDKGPKITQLRLSGAEISGNLDLRRAELTGNKSDAVALRADGLSVSGNILLSDGFVAEGEIRLDGCKIQGNLDCTGASLTNKNGYSLSADAAEIAGTVYLRAGSVRFTSIGVVSFEVAKIEGDLDCSGGHFIATAFSQKATHREHDVYAIIADNLKVGADVKFMAGFTAKGVVTLINARIGGDVRCDKGHFKFPGEVTLWADGIIVSATTYLDSAMTDGILRFSQADLKLGLVAENVTFYATKCYRGWFADTSRIKSDLGERACGIYAPYAVIGGVFSWRGIKRYGKKDQRDLCWLYLFGAKADDVQDDADSWAAVDRFNITDCTYERFSQVAREWQRLLQVFDREYAILNKSRVQNWMLGWRVFWRKFPGRKGGSDDFAVACARFEPQPYIQLSRTLLDAGHQAAAKSVSAHLERNRTRYSDYRMGRQLWQWLLDATLRYGYSPFRPVLILGVWALICAFLFQIAFDHKQIVSIRERQSPTGVQSEPIPVSANVTFNPVIYSIDTLVPIVDLNQKRNWIVEPLSSHPHPRDPQADWLGSAGGVWDSVPHLTGALIVFNTFFGWLMTTLFAAGITGLLRTKE